MKRLAAANRFMATAAAGGNRTSRQAGRGSSPLALSGSATPAMAYASRIHAFQLLSSRTLEFLFLREETSVPVWCPESELPF